MYGSSYRHVLHIELINGFYPETGKGKHFGRFDRLGDEEDMCQMCDKVCQTVVTVVLQGTGNAPDKVFLLDDGHGVIMVLSFMIRFVVAKLTGQM